MEMNEMQTLWKEMSAEVEKQKKITDSLIIKITQQHYRDKINKIYFPEVVSTLGCFALVIFILVNLPGLTNWYLLACGIVSAAILTLLPILSLKSIHKLKSIKSPGMDLKHSLENYSKAKLQFVSVQKLSFILGAMLMVAILPVMGILIAEKDFFKETNIWLWYCVGFPFYYLFARWVFKSYKRIADSAGNILKELGELS